jgi:hypothetical protein
MLFTLNYEYSIALKGQFIPTQRNALGWNSTGYGSALKGQLIFKPHA